MTSVGFIGFGSFSSSNPEITRQQTPSAPMESSDTKTLVGLRIYYEGDDSEIATALKRWAKKDATTKMKALQELRRIVSVRPVTSLRPAIGNFIYFYSKTLFENNRRVRDLTSMLLRDWVLKQQKAFERHIGAIIGDWWILSRDTSSREASSTTKEALQIFVGSNFRDDLPTLLSRHREQIFEKITEHLVATPENLVNSNLVSPQDCEECYERVVETTLAALSDLVSMIPILVGNAREDSAATQTFATMVSKKVWRLAGSKRSGIRRGAYHLIGTLCQHVPNLIASQLSQALSVLPTFLSERAPTNHSCVWSAILNFLSVYPHSWENQPFRNAFFGKFWTALEHGLYGGGEKSYQSLVPFLLLTPAQLFSHSDGPDNFPEKFLSALWAGLKSPLLGPNSRFLIATYLDCVSHFLNARTKYGKETRNIEAVLAQAVFNVQSFLATEKSLSDNIRAGLGKIYAESVAPLLTDDEELATSVRKNLWENLEYFASTKDNSEETVYRVRRCVQCVILPMCVVIQKLEGYEAHTEFTNFLGKVLRMFLTSLSGELDTALPEQSNPILNALEDLFKGAVQNGFSLGLVAGDVRLSLQRWLPMAIKSKNISESVVRPLIDLAYACVTESPGVANDIWGEVISVMDDDAFTECSALRKLGSLRQSLGETVSLPVSVWAKSPEVPHKTDPDSQTTTDRLFDSHFEGIVNGLIDTRELREDFDMLIQAYLCPCTDNAICQVPLVSSSALCRILSLIYDRLSDSARVDPFVHVLSSIMHSLVPLLSICDDSLSPQVLEALSVALVSCVYINGLELGLLWRPAVNLWNDVCCVILEKRSLHFATHFVQEALRHINIVEAKTIRTAQCYANQYLCLLAIPQLQNVAEDFLMHDPFWSADFWKMARSRESTMDTWIYLVDVLQELSSSANRRNLVQLLSRNLVKVLESSGAAGADVILEQLFGCYLQKLKKITAASDSSWMAHDILSLRPTITTLLPEVCAKGLIVQFLLEPLFVRCNNSFSAAEERFCATYLTHKETVQPESKSVCRLVNRAILKDLSMFYLTPEPKKTTWQPSVQAAFEIVLKRNQDLELITLMNALPVTSLQFPLTKNIDAVVPDLILKLSEQMSDDLENEQFGSVVLALSAWIRQICEFSGFRDEIRHLLTEVRLGLSTEKFRNRCPSVRTLQPLVQLLGSIVSICDEEIIEVDLVFCMAVCAKALTATKDVFSNPAPSEKADMLVLIQHTLHLIRLIYQKTRSIHESEQFQALLLKVPHLYVALTLRSNQRGSKSMDETSDVASVVRGAAAAHESVQEIRRLYIDGLMASGVRALVVLSRANLSEEDINRLYQLLSDSTTPPQQMVVVLAILHTSALSESISKGQHAISDDEEEEKADALITDKVLNSTFANNLGRLFEQKAVFTHHSYSDDLARLAHWLLLLDHIDAVSSDLPEGRASFSTFVKQRHILSAAMIICLRHLKTNVSPPEGITVATYASLMLAEDLSLLASYVIIRTVCALPALVRQWWNDECDRSLSSLFAEYTQALCWLQHISPYLMQKEIEAICDGEQKNKWDMSVMTVKVSKISKEVSARYTQDDCSLEMVIKIPSTYPLRNVDVQCTRRLGVSEDRWRRWVLQIIRLLAQQDGSVLDAVLLWKRNVDKEFEGVEPCPICYSVLNPKTHNLPRLPCRTCSNKYHKSCLYKWFNESGKNKCPICQQAFH